MRYVDVRIDNGEWERFDCALGFEQPGIQTGYLAPGVHSIELVALDAQYFYPTHYFTGTLTTQAHAPVASDYQLQWSVGGAAISCRCGRMPTAIRWSLIAASRSGLSGCQEPISWALHAVCVR